MRNVWLLLVLCGLQLAAAEKSRDWKTGQVVESDQTTASLHTIASMDRNYLVRGNIGSDEKALAVGASVRFAVEDKTMFISSDGKEYRLYILGERVAAAKDPGVPAPKTAPVQSAEALKPAIEVAKPAPDSSESPANALDNDAIVKMILGGLKEDTIVRVIESRPGKYILTKDALAGLKAAGVPPTVIAAMSAKMTARH
jgi:hypothetical protein